MYKVGAMDKAFIDDKIVSAHEISQDYAEEKAIRKQSRNKKILCIDPNCKNRILRYCHGDKKGAYFAHLVNSECDYDTFDKQDNAVFKALRIKLFNRFTMLGYKIETECKLLKHHYSPVLCSKDDKAFVIEMGDSKTTLGYVERLLEEYASIQMPVKWIVVGEQNLWLREDNVSFLKRFLLNESKNNDFILVDGTEIIQYRLDKNTYALSFYNKIYSEKDSLQNLCIVDGELSINGFNSRYELWRNEREEASNLELKRREERQKEQKHQALLKSKNEDPPELIIEKDIQIKGQENTRANNISNIRVYTCTKCGKTGGNSDFYMTQGNSGICWECQYGPERYAEIKKHRGW